MKLDIDDVKKMMSIGMLKVSALGNRKGPTVVIYKDKGFYVWKTHTDIVFQRKWVWNRKYAFSLSDVLD